MRTHAAAAERAGDVGERRPLPRSKQRAEHGRSRPPPKFDATRALRDTVQPLLQEFDLQELLLQEFDLHEFLSALQPPLPLQEFLPLQPLSLLEQPP